MFRRLSPTLLILIMLGISVILGGVVAYTTHRFVSYSYSYPDPNSGVEVTNVDSCRVVLTRPEYNEPSSEDMKKWCRGLLYGRHYEYGWPVASRYVLIPEDPSSDTALDHHLRFDFFDPMFTVDGVIANWVFYSLCFTAAGVVGTILYRSKSGY